MSKPLTLAEFLSLFGDVIAAARFADTITPEMLIYGRGVWSRRDGDKHVVADPPAALAPLLAVAEAAMAHPFCAIRHGDYCGTHHAKACSCTTEYAEREAKRRAGDPLLRAVDEARRKP